MIETSAGLVLRTRLLTETSLIVHWLTPGLGRIATVAKGARRPKSPFRGKLDLFYLADFSFRRSRRSELHTLTEVALRESHRPLRKDLHRLQQASYCAALIEQTSETETPVPALFELVRGLLAHLCAQPVAPKTVLAFELKLLRELGLMPEMDQTRLKPETAGVAEAFASADWPQLDGLQPDALQMTELRQFLHGFLIYHLDRLPKGREAALGLRR